MKAHPVVHVSWLRPYHANTFPGRTQPPPPPTLYEQGTVAEHTVELVLDHHYDKRRKRREYLVLWQGYPREDATWEPRKHLVSRTGKNQALLEYEANHPELQVRQ